MSYFLLTSKNTLPEQFQAEIPVTDKTKIAEKLVVESFITESNYQEARAELSTVPVVGRVRFVNGYTVTSIICLESEQEALDLKSIFIGIRDRNANQLNREWTHPNDPNQYVITTATEEEWQALALSPDKVAIGEINFTPA